MIRTIIKPNTPSINLSIPAEYIGEEVEILVFPISSAVKSVDVDEQHNKRQKAFSSFMKYKGILPADFDYEKELAEYRDARYDHID